MIKKKFGAHIASFIFKTICMLLILAIFCIFIWRMVASLTPSSLKRAIPNDALVDAYDKHGQITVFEQKQNTMTRAESNSGYFCINGVKFYEEAEQVQLVFRYNNSTLEHLREDYNLPATPDRRTEHYDVTLTVAYDLTPDNTDDNASNDPESVRFERFSATLSTDIQTKSMYNFKKYVFDGIKTDSTVLAIYADIYYNNDIDYDSEAYGTLCIYDYRTSKQYSDLSGKEIKLIENYTK